ncbi:hypothetical protein [Methanopyrus sp. SNP6]|uniref:hypothetical protein n=1 Tax=Methanopyrus sp. SNP6 TaxID=1937005 RepID=UPI0011E5ED32|nr:hypothetical protein [Methanopyrus sp. SNP6]
MKDMLWWLLTVVYAPDFEKWMRWCPVVCSHPLSYYSATDVHYPPLGSLLPALVWYVGTNMLGLSPHTWEFRVLWKMPTWLGAIVCIYLIRWAGVGKVGMLIAAASMAYPCVFWQLDTISMVPALATAVCEGKLAGLCAATALWMKPTAGIVALPFLRRQSIPTFLLASVLICGPYLVANGWDFIYDVVIFQAKRPPQNCSIWTLVTWRPGLEDAVGMLSVVAPLATRGNPELAAGCIGLALLAFSKVVNPNYWAVGCPMVCLISWKQGAMVLSTAAYFLTASAVSIATMKEYYNAEDGRRYDIRELFIPPPPTTDLSMGNAAARYLLETSILYHFLVTSCLYIWNLRKLAVSSYASFPTEHHGPVEPARGTRESRG